MKVYKIKHKPTGLFYKPSKFRSEVNLSKIGKSYSRRPSLKHICQVRVKVEGTFNTFVELEWKEEDFEIIEFEVVHK